MSKLKEMLDKYRGIERRKLRVGIMADKTYPDGQKVAFVGYVNEYGYEGMIPARKQTIFHSVNQDGSMRNDGKFVKAKDANLERVVDVPEYKLKIPARPFFRSAIADNKQRLREIIASALKEKGADEALALGGNFMADALKQSVMTWSDPENAKSTQRAKGYNAPLRANDRILRNSFSYEIEQ